MFGSRWLDGLAVAVFATTAALSLARLAVSGRAAAHGGRAGAVAHVTMAAGMAAMTAPGADPVPRWGWLLAFGTAATWFAVVLARLGPASGPAGLAMGAREWRSRAAPAAHHLAGCLLMLVAVGAGHRGHHATAGPLATAHRGHGAASSTGAVLPTPLAWLVSVSFLLLAAWWTVDLLRSPGPVPARGIVGVLAAPAVASGCAIVMAAGMGAMALTLG